MAETIRLDGTRTHSGTAQGGGASSITLASGASAVDGYYNWRVVEITAGQGAGQANIITGYTGASKVATVATAWATAPNATSVYRVGSLTLTNLFDVRQDIEVPVAFAGEVITTLSLVTRYGRAIARVNLNVLDYMLSVGRTYTNNPQQDELAWLVIATDGESERRARLTNAERKPMAADGGYGGALQLTSNGRAIHQLALTHDAAWESPTATTYEFVSGGGSASLAGGKVVTATGYYGGTANGRIGRLSLRANNYYSAQGDEIERIWLGIRPTRNGVTNFQPVWECEDCWFASDDTNPIYAAAGASGGQAARVQFSDVLDGTDDMNYRIIMQLGDYTSDPEEMVGRYTVLLRYQVTGVGTEVGVRVGTRWDRFYDARTLDVLATQYLSYTAGNWRIAELGDIAVPPNYRDGMRQIFENWNEFAVQIDAERNAGAGELWLDCIYLIPAEHKLFLERAYLLGSDTWYTHVVTDEDGQIRYNTLSQPVVGLVYASGEPQAWEWAMPRDGGALVFVGEREAKHLLTDSLKNVYIEIYKRWMSYRA